VAAKYLQPIRYYNDRTRVPQMYWAYFPVTCSHFFRTCAHLSCGNFLPRLCAAWFKTLLPGYFDAVEK
jgi:hypothetical protein